MKQNPVVRYLLMLVYMILALALRVVCCLPLALAMDGNAMLALLTPALWLLIVLPLRFSFAEAMVGESFCPVKAFSLGRYGAKLKESIVHALSVLKWGVPMAALLGYFYWWYTQEDAITLIRAITDLGSSTDALWSQFVGFFGIERAPMANTLMEGLYVVLAIVGVALLIGAAGVARNSATRYLWAQGVKCGKRAACLKGSRGKQLLVGLVNLLLLVPFALAVAYVLKGVVSTLSTQLMFLLAGSEVSIDLSSAFLPLAGCFVGLYMTLLPVRRWLTASFVKSLKATKTVEQ